MNKLMQKYQSLVAVLPFKNWSLSLLVINLLGILGVGLAMRALPPLVPLFYGMPYGVEQLASKSSLILPGSVSLGTCILSIIISKAVGDDFLKKVLFGGMIISTILALTTTVKIIFLIA